VPGELHEPGNLHKLKDPGCSSHVPSQGRTTFIDGISQALTMTYSSINHDEPTDRDRL
jgi:hypothetical protein